jgi:peptidoglycan/LPS O-acetylase OafA/YrhL
VNSTGYIINAILVLLVLRQIRESRLDLVSLVLPVLLVAGAAAYYLHSVPTAGNDVALDITLAATGLALGAFCALATHLRRGQHGIALAKAGWLAAALWIAGIGSRMGFAFVSDHGAGPAIARFSVAHSITGADAWVAALVIMALAEVIARLGVLRLRARILPAAARAERTPARVQE